MTSVRAMREEDVDAVAALSTRLFESSAWSAPELRAELARSFAEVWVAEEAVGIIGYAVAWFVGDDGELLTVGTDPAQRRRGVGRALVERVQASAASRAARSLVLEVRPSNAAAVALYERLGFARLDVRRAYYADGEDALIMAWQTAR